MLNISLILDCPNLGVFLGKKTIAPRYTTWSLPGAQVTHTTAVDSGLIMIGRDLPGIDLDPSPKHFIAAYVGDVAPCKAQP